MRDLETIKQEIEAAKASLKELSAEYHSIELAEYIGKRYASTIFGDREILVESAMPDGRLKCLISQRELMYPGDLKDGFTEIAD